jgi:hypothetical protein
MIFIFQRLKRLSLSQSSTPWGDEVLGCVESGRCGVWKVLVVIGKSILSLRGVWNILIVDLVLTIDVRGGKRVLGALSLEQSVAMQVVEKPSSN